MYKKNKRNLQPFLLSDVNNLPPRTQKYLQNSWAETFRREVFLRIPEDRFAGLYDADPSRPNVPVNILVGLEILKEWHGWSDEEMYEHFLFDLQVRYALGCDTFGEGDFDLRTLYYFRGRLSKHALEKGENLMTVVFESITDEQIKRLNVNTTKQRMDSTQVMSNIADLSRLELLVQVMQRLHRILSPEDQDKYAEIFRPYIKEGAGQYTYRIKGREAVWEHIAQIGVELHQLLRELAGYRAEAVYQVAERFFEENFKLVETQVKAKTNEEIKPGCLQSLDDLEASYRKKCNRSYKGYVANLAETCDEENGVQLITQVKVEPNRVSDIELLKDGLPSLKQRTGVDTLVTDGGYTGPSVDEMLRTQQVEQIATGLVGALPVHPDGKLAMSDFDLHLAEDGILTQAICPGGQAAVIETRPGAKSYRLLFSEERCQTCVFYQTGRCPAGKFKTLGQFGFRLPKERAISSCRIRKFLSCKEQGRALRPAIEATVYQVKHALHRGKVRVRGLFRTTCVITCAAIAANLRRIFRYEKDKQRGKYTSVKPRMASFSFFLPLFNLGFGLLHSLLDHLNSPEAFEITFLHHAHEWSH